LVNSAGEAQLAINGLRVGERAALRMTERGVSISALENTLAQTPFRYFHEGAWKTGFYDPSSRIVAGAINGELTTVINGATPRYIENLMSCATTMKITYDKSTDAAYIYLAAVIEAGGVAKTYCCDPLEVNGQIHLDFDKQGRLVGIEVLGASKLLPEAVLPKEKP
jgi:uncharacterized protein YuzE